MKYAIIFGTRPEIIKLYSTIKHCIDNNLEYITIHSNQHYDPNMDTIFFDQLSLPQPTYNLNIGSGKHGDMTGRMLIKIEEILINEKVDLVFVQGDTNTVMAGALAASKLGIKVAHIEAGLRSYDRTMPEEVNRIITDHISDYLFPPTNRQVEILKGEGLTKGVCKVGNTVVDVVYKFKDNLKTISNILEKHSLKENQYIILTCHRPSNTDNDIKFKSILESIDNICKENNWTCIFPAHPRLKTKHDLIGKYTNIKVIEPVGFFDSLTLQNYSAMIFTDSGGIQEESCILGKKCVILRTNTERPETVEAGGAILCNDINVEEITKSFNTVKKLDTKWSNPFGDGHSAEYIFDFIEKN